MKNITILLFLILLICSPVCAEIEKVAIPCETGICFYWWPKLPSVGGWHHERDQSINFSANAQAPDGYTFANAETVIYAKALYKPRIPETKTLNILIDNDIEEFKSHSPNVSSSEVAPITNGDNQKQRSFTFFPKGEGNWEQVSYGEEDDFYLIFTISSRTKEGYSKELGTFKKFVVGYKK